jgi:hypothetical protein
MPAKCELDVWSDSKVAGGDMLYAVALGRLIAVWLSLDGEKWRQEVAWNLEGVGGPNPVLAGKTLYVYQGKKGASVKALEAATGDIAQRHIAALGHVRLAENNSAPTCWGNRAGMSAIPTTNTKTQGAR